MLAVGRVPTSDPKPSMLDEPSLGLARRGGIDVRDVRPAAPPGADDLLAEQSIELCAGSSDFAPSPQVGRSVLSGTAAALAADPEVEKADLGSAEQDQTSRLLGARP